MKDANSDQPINIKIISRDSSVLIVTVQKNMTIKDLKQIIADVFTCYIYL